MMKSVRVRFIATAGLLCSAWLPSVNCGSSNGSGGGGHGGAGGGVASGGTGGAAASGGAGFLPTDAALDVGGFDAAAVDAGPFPRVLASFDLLGDAGPGLEGFALDVADNEAGSLDVAADGGAAATLGWSGTEGSPQPGALVSNAPFGDYGQFIDVRKSYTTNFPQDWTGKKTLQASVKIASGLDRDPRASVQIQLYVQSYSGMPDGGPSSTCPPKPAKCYVPPSNPSDGGVLSLQTCSSVISAPSDKGWHVYTLDLRTCARPFALDTIVALGVIVGSGDAPGAHADGGPLDAGAGVGQKPTAGLIYFDTFQVVE